MSARRHNRTSHRNDEGIFENGMVFSPLLGDVGLEKADSRFLTSVFSMYSCRRERQDSPVASSAVFLLFPVQTSTSHEEKNPFANLFSPTKKGRRERDFIFVVSWKSF